MVVLLFKVAFQFSLASLIGSICLIKLTENSNENTRRIALLSLKWKRQCRLIGIILPNPLRGDDVTARQRSCWEEVFLVMSVILFGEERDPRRGPNPLQNSSTWTSLYKDPPPTHICSNLFTVNS